MEASAEEGTAEGAAFGGAEEDNLEWEASGWVPSEGTRVAISRRV